MSELPRYSGTDAQRDTLEALRAIPQVEVKRFELLSSWPQTVVFDRVRRPVAIMNAGCWERDDPHASPTVTGFLWVPKIDGVDVTFTGPTADKMQVVTLVAMGER